MRLETEDVERLRVLSAGVENWPRLVEAARRHKTATLLDKHLEEHCADLVPVDIASGLHQIRTEFRARGRQLELDLRWFLDTIEPLGIQAIPFKGPVLSTWAFGGDHSLRQAMDLDVLVRNDEILRLRDLFAPLGFAPHLQPPERTDRRRLRSIYCYDYPILRRSPPLLIELHWGFAPWFMGFFLDLPSLWESRSMVEVGGARTAALGQVERVLVLSVYAARRKWARLGSLVDLAEVLRRETPDWSSLLAQARSLHILRILGVSLCMVHEQLGVPLPTEVRAEFERDPGMNRVLSAATERLAELLVAEAPPYSNPGYTFLQSRERVRDRLRYALPAGLRMLQPRGENPSAADYLRRPFQLLHRFGLGPVAKLFSHVVGRS